MVEGRLLFRRRGKQRGAVTMLPERKPRRNHPSSRAFPVPGGVLIPSPVQAADQRDPGLHPPEAAGVFAFRLEERGALANVNFVASNKTPGGGPGALFLIFRKCAVQHPNNEGLGSHRQSWDAE